MNNYSPTPRTDAFTTSLYNESCAAAADVPGYSGRDIPPEEAYGMAVDFAKGLEREVAELRAMNEAMHEDLHEHDEKRHWAEVKVAELREAAKRVLNAHLRDPNYFLDHEVTAARIEYNESRAALERLIYAPPAQGGSEG